MISDKCDFCGNDLNCMIEWGNIPPSKIYCSNACLKGGNLHEQLEKMKKVINDLYTKLEKVTQIAESLVESL